MNKENSKKLLPAFIMSVLLVFYSIASFEGTTSDIVIGVILMLLSFSVMTLGILMIFLKNEQINKIASLAFDIIYPLYMIIVTILDMVNLALLFSVNGWIIYILLDIFALLYIIFRLISAFSAKDNVIKLSSLFNVIFVAVMVLTFVFSPYGTLYNIGNISIFKIVLFVCFILITSSTLFSKFKNQKE